MLLDGFRVFGFNITYLTGISHHIQGTAGMAFEVGQLHVVRCDAVPDNGPQQARGPCASPNLCVCGCVNQKEAPSTMFSLLS